MENLGLIQNFARIIRTLQDDNMGTTEIAHVIGYTSTSQLNNTLEGKSMLSTKAILTMIERLNVNPIYLFMGKGDMFLNESEETEFTKLYNEFNKLVTEHENSLETIKKLTRRNLELEKVSSDLLKNAAAMVEYYRSNSINSENQETSDSKEII